MIKQIAIIIFISIIALACEKKKKYHFKLDTIEKTYELFTYDPKKSFPMVLAHRGGKYKGYPENAIESFEYMMQFSPMVIQCQLNYSADDSVFIFRDDTLSRTTNGIGNIHEMTYPELKRLELIDYLGNNTPYKIPTLSEMLDWANGRAFLIINPRHNIPFDRLLEQVKAHDALNYICIVARNVEEAMAIDSLDSTVMISVNLVDTTEYKRLHRTGVDPKRMIAYTGKKTKSEKYYYFMHGKGIMNIIKAAGKLDEKAKKTDDDLYIEMVQLGVDIISTDRPVEVSKELNFLIINSQSFPNFVEYK
ncbi:glycerophosphodiester phosphodiesterase family protein [Aureibacter tunicatorum]|uniref:Glycerophosphoryl diester phosphodiesterase n=1 Tax=Aureibacter tunicatorum TaxID=866807 RepID=A0AAE3XLW7_9BACT|nr:glycerophosphodiester phosphodiesterase family protein [Aureibacter tunicatorum]MDR6238350.1 glycerophosphoryl diester phosphodiesterase [Aureibacter tunicatorum]BDD03382.1 glycerophosphoryl diester phosphodiesterase [Aureibacter tunicatorum]